MTNLDWEALFRSYLSQAEIHGKSVAILRVSGSSIDLALSHLIKEDDFLGDKGWIKLPLDNEFRCLPLGRVVIKSPDFGSIVAKAEVIGKDSGMQHYLIGSETGSLIDQLKIKPKPINFLVPSRKQPLNLGKRNQNDRERPLLSQKKRKKERVTTKGRLIPRDEEMFSSNKRIENLVDRSTEKR